MRYLKIFVSLMVIIACPATGWTDWSSVPLEKWSAVKSMDTTIGLQPQSGVWSEQDGGLTIEGKADCWDTRLMPGDLGADTCITVGFTIDKSSRVARRLPVMQTARWAYHYGENASGWDFGVVVHHKDPLHFYRIGLSGHRGELALWDSLGEFLQLVPCAIEVGKPHRLEIVCRGACFVVTLDGKQVLNYVDRSAPHAGGRAGLAVWRSEVIVSQFDASRIAAETTPYAGHRPDFRFELDGTTAILFDGHEPISRYFKATRDGSGALFQSCIKLQPGGRTVYYTWLGPAITPGPGHGVLPLVGDLPDAFNVTRRGEELHFTFRTDRTGTAKAEHKCIVRYDSKRGVYRYEYESDLTFTVTEPFEINAFELIDPLTQNNRPAGSEVVYGWNDLNHRWHLYQGPDRRWYRYPLIDHLLECNNHETYWGKFANVLYPDESACPSFEIDIAWKRDPKRHFQLGLCHWGYDYHHRESGSGDPVSPGQQRRFGVTLTAMPPAAANTVFEQSVLAPKVTASPDEFAVFNPACSTFAELSTRQDPKSMIIWRGGQVDKKVGRMDDHSLRIDGPGKAWVQIYQHAIEANADRWWVRGWYKSRGVTGRGLQCRTKYSYGEQPERIFYMDGRGGSDWTYFSFVTDVFKQRDCTDVGFELDGMGAVWLDDVAVSALEPGHTPEETTWPVPAALEPSTDVLIDLPMDAKPIGAVYDASHNGHHLMLAGGPQWLQEDGRGFLRLDGTDDGATIPLKPRLQALDCKVPMGQIKTLFPLEAFTYEFWTRPQIPVDGPNASVALLNYRWNVNLFFSQFNEADKTCRLYYQNDRRTPTDRWQATGHVRIERRVPYDGWLHIATTHADGQVVLYVNGEPAGDATYDTGTPGFEFFMVGETYHIGWTYGGGRHYRGDIGPIRLYAKALSAEEVAERYQTGWGQIP